MTTHLDCIRDSIGSVESIAYLLPAHLLGALEALKRCCADGDGGAAHLSFWSYRTQRFIECCDDHKAVLAVECLNYAMLTVRDGACRHKLQAKPCAAVKHWAGMAAGMVAQIASMVKQ